MLHTPLFISAGSLASRISAVCEFSMMRLFSSLSFSSSWRKKKKKKGSLSIVKFTKRESMFYHEEMINIYSETGFN
jgi:hypothetical protein